MTMMHVLPVLSTTFATTIAALDIDGFLLSSEFLGSLATLISSILVGILNIFLFGAIETT